MRGKICVGFVLLACSTLGAMVVPAAQAQFVFDAPVRSFPDREVDIQSVQVQLNLDAARRTLSGEMTADIVASASNVLEFTWPAHGALLDSVSIQPVAGDTALAVVRGDSLVFTLQEPLKPGQAATISVSFRLEAGRGFEVSGDPAEADSCCLWTNRTWLPLPDDPGDRFQANLAVRAPEDWHVVAGGGKSINNGLQRFSPVRSVRVHDLGLVAGRFSQATAGTVRFHLAPGVADPGDARMVVPSVRDYVERKSGYRLPWDSLDIVIAPSWVPARTLPGVQLLPERRPYPLGLRPRWDTEDMEEYRLASLIARQWTHAVLSPDWWTESWVNDGLAGALALTYLEERGTSVERVRALLSEAYFEESNRYVRPLVWDRFFEPEDLQDLHAQAKGPLVLHTVSTTVGPSLFWASVRRLLARHAFGVLDSDILLALLEPDGPGVISRLFDAFIFAAGHPEITVSLPASDGGSQAAALITQTQDYPLVPRVFPLETELEWLPFNEPARRGVSLRERSETVSLTSVLPPRYVTVDPDGHHLMDVRHESDLSGVSSRLRYGSHATRWKAAGELVRFSEDPAISLTLRLALEAEHDDLIRARLVRSATALPPTPTHRELLSGFLFDESAEVRLAAIDALVQLFPGGEANPAMDALARRDTEPRVQAAAVESVLGPDAEALARSALITPSDGDVVRGAGLRVLAREDAAIRDDFLALTSPALSPGQIIQGLSLAAYISTARPLRIRILALLDHPDPRVRQAAADAGQDLLIAGNRGSVERLLEAEWHRGARDGMSNLVAWLTADR